MAEEVDTPEEYLREHAQRLRVYARYTTPKAAMRLMDTARFLEWEADRARERSLVDTQKRKRV